MLPYYREKDQTKKLLAELGVRVPENRQLAPDFADSDLAGFAFPLVINPYQRLWLQGYFCRPFD